MRAKSLTLSFFSIFIVAMLAVFVSAAIVLDPTTQSVSINQGNSDSFTFTIENTAGDNSTYSNFTSVVSDLTGTAGTISSSQVTVGTLPSSLTAGSITSSITVTVDVPSSQAVGTYDGTITIDAGGSPTNPNPQDITLSVTVTAPTPNEPEEVRACRDDIGNPGNLKVKDIDFNNLGTLILKESSGNIYLEFGDDDEWFPLDYVEVEIEIENNGDFDIDDIEVEWGIYDTRSNELIIEFEDEKDFNLKDGKDEIITVSFQLEDDLDIDLDELDDGKHYRFYVTVTGTIDDSKAGVLDGDETCASGFDNAEIVIENDFVILTDVQYPETVQCGETVQISAKVWNIGDDDQDEVKVEVHNNDLGLFHKTTEIGDIDEFDDDVYNFNFKVPNDAEEKTHSLRFEVLDEDFDVYENDFDDDDSAFTLPFRVSGGCAGVMEKGVLVSANIESGGKAGEELVVRATVTNNNDELQVFTVNAAGFSQWASSYTADRTSLVLASGASADVRFTFDVNKDASGSQSFVIELVSEDNQVTTQPVSVAIEKRSNLFGGLTGSITSGNNAYLWGIGILNVILVLVIIIVAVRVLRK